MPKNIPDVEPLNNLIARTLKIRSIVGVRGLSGEDLSSKDNVLFPEKRGTSFAGELYILGNLDETIHCIFHAGSIQRIGIDNTLDNR